jgi:membrane fusion protein, multidrug efflux system
MIELQTRPGDRAIALLAMLALLSAMLLAACSSGSGSSGADSARKEAVPVTVAVAIKKDIPLQVRAIGTVEPFLTVSIKSQIDGQVAKVNFQDGQRVKKDDLLFTIDQRPFEAALHQAEANLARDVAEAKNARVVADRDARLLAGGFVSTDEHDQAQTKAVSLEAAVKADKAAAENAKLRLQYCYLRSPIDGKVGQVLVDAGNVVKNNETILAVVNQIDPVYVTFSVPEQELPEIRRRMAAEKLAVEVSFAGDQGNPVTGELSFINNTVDTTTGTVLLKAVFDNETERLWPGQFVQVAMTLSVQHDAVVVPPQAVQPGQAGQFVFIVGPDLTVQVRPVTVGQTKGSETVITTGLAAGERVVTEGQIRLAAGMTLQIKKAADNEDVADKADRQS